MRLWSIHPKYLDSKGLVALWRESLLAKHVLEGKTKGYLNHPQLLRFKLSQNPIDSINYYLQYIQKESLVRGYTFDSNKFEVVKNIESISVTEGQIKYEAMHLRNKLKIRDSQKLSEIKDTKKFIPHPLFKIINGDVEEWEKNK